MTCDVTGMTRESSPLPRLSGGGRKDIFDAADQEAPRYASQLCQWPVPAGWDMARKIAEATRLPGEGVSGKYGKL